MSREKIPLCSARPSSLNSVIDASKAESLKVDVRRLAFTLVETLVSISILSLLAALTLAAVQKVRAAAARTVCQNNLRQLAFALHQYHGANGVLPKGISGKDSADGTPFLGWHVRVLPYVEQPGMYDQAVAAYKQDKNFLNSPPHVGLEQAVKVFGCPTDPRTLSPQFTRHKTTRGTTAYLGNEGVSSFRMEGVLFLDSAVKLTDITDGTANTLLVGERPPSADLVLGWWYAGWGQDQDGEAEMVMGSRVKNRLGSRYSCAVGPHHFGPGKLTDDCATFHYWSLHPGGAHFAYADGSVKFLAYSADAILPALSTRAAGDTVAE